VRSLQKQELVRFVSKTSALGIKPGKADPPPMFSWFWRRVGVFLERTVSQMGIACHACKRISDAATRIMSSSMCWEVDNAGHGPPGSSAALANCPTYLIPEARIFNGRSSTDDGGTSQICWSRRLIHALRLKSVCTTHARRQKKRQNPNATGIVSNSLLLGTVFQHIIRVLRPCFAGKKLVSRNTP
jgi:hypothetical protein